MTQKSLQDELRRSKSLYRGDRPGPGAPWGGGKGEGWINGSKPTNLTRQWARGPANLERAGGILEARWAILRHLGGILGRLGGSLRHHVGQDEPR